MAQSPTVAVSTIITNPYSTNYFSYLAFIESWAPFVDEVILVDGNTDDSSLEIAKSWVSPADWAKVRVVNTPHTYWHTGYRWHALQAMHNYYVGQCATECDWVITVNADNVLYGDTAKSLRQHLAQNSDVDAVYFYRGKPSNGAMHRRMDNRATAVNMRRVRANGSSLGFGVESRNKMGFDFSIVASSKTTFRDPVTGVVKNILAGEPYAVERIIELECAVFGHFFFDAATLYPKLNRWDRAFARYAGMAFRRDTELRLKIGAYGIRAYRNKDEAMNPEHPLEINRVIDQFYEPGMLGGAIRRVSPTEQRAARIQRKLLGIERNLRTRWMRARGYRGLKELHEWVPLDAPDPEPLNVANAYAEQDHFIRKHWRIDGLRGD